MNRIKIFKIMCLCALLNACKQSPSSEPSRKEQDVSLNDKKNFVLPEGLRINKREEIKFDDDLQKETIITASDSLAENYYEFWLKDEKMVYEFKYPWVSINYKWLADLDNDGKKEIIRAQGYEDGVNYTIFEIKGDKQIPLLYFNPAFEDNLVSNQFYWAYPNDIQKPIVDNFKLKVSKGNNFQREGNYLKPENQTELPFIFFEGKTSQPDMKITSLNEPQFFTLKELNDILTIKNNPKSTISVDSNAAWIGRYSGDFLRIKEEFADPRAYATINMNIDANGAKFQLDSYKEIIDKNLVIESREKSKIILSEKDDKNSKFSLTKVHDVYLLKSNLLNKTTGEISTYKLEKK